MISSDIPPCNSSDKEHDKWSGDNHTWLANRSAQCGKKGRVGRWGREGAEGGLGAASKPGPLAAVSLPLPKVARAREGSCFRSAAQLGWLARVSNRYAGACARGTCGGIRMSERARLCACSVATQMLRPHPPPTSRGSRGWQIYRAALQRLALHSKPTSSSSSSSFFFF